MLSASAQAPLTPLPKLQLTTEQRAELMKSLEGQHRQYDEAEKMLKKKFSSPGYHTTLKGGDVHPTRDALSYAAALLDTGDKVLQSRAEEILHRVIALQDQNPESKTYGIWSWFMEEPLDKMAPPDWNWADFNGVQLLHVAINHRERLPADLQKMVDDAIVHASRSIQRRDVKPGYTNIAIMGTYVTLVASDLYNLPDLREYAMMRLKRFADYTRHHGGFTEYNSPTYTTVALDELARLKMHARGEDEQRIAGELYDIAWQEIAQHYHVPTGQWAGPHSRAYGTLLGGAHKTLIQRALEGRDEPRLPKPLPVALRPFFTGLDAPRLLVKTFTKGDKAREERDLVGTTYLHPSFALGSINTGEMWNQRRPLLAYWGSKEKPSFMRVRVLHDGYDFSAAQFAGVQQDNRVLAGLGFATDGGDTHISLDRIKDATVRAKDLRLRFEFGGDAAQSTLVAPDSLTLPAALKFGEVRVHLAVPFAQFGETIGRWQTGRDKDTSFLDVVLYEGDEKTIRLDALEAAALGIGVQISTSDEVPAMPVPTTQAGRLELNWPPLRLALPLRPAKAADLKKSLVIEGAPLTQ